MCYNGSMRQLDKTTHNSIRRSVTKELDKHNIYYATQKASGRGVPDIICCMDGEFVAIEIKKQGDKLRRSQLWQADMIHRSGGEVHTVRSREDLENIISSHKEKNHETGRGN